MFQRQHQKNMKTTTTVTKNSVKSRKTENLEKDMSVGVHVCKASEMQDKMWRADAYTVSENQSIQYQTSPDLAREKNLKLSLQKQLDTNL